MTGADKCERQYHVAYDPGLISINGDNRGSKWISTPCGGAIRQ